MTAADGISRLIQDAGPSAYPAVKALYPHVPEWRVAELVSVVAEHFYKAREWRDDPVWAAFRWRDDPIPPAQQRQVGEDEAARETGLGDGLIAAFITAHTAAQVSDKSRADAEEAQDRRHWTEVALHAARARTIDKRGS